MNTYTEFEKELLERISNIDSRLESIERMLGDQEEDCPVVDSKEAMDKLDERLSRPDPILEPEWRPMSTAPRDGRYIQLERALNKRVAICRWCSDEQVWVHDVIGIMFEKITSKENEFLGWRPL